MRKVFFERGVVKGTKGLWLAVFFSHPAGTKNKMGQVYISLVFFISCSAIYKEVTMTIKTKFVNSMKELSSVKSLTLASMILAIIVIMGFFANFTLTIFPMVKISFGFVPQSIGAMILGPVVSSMICGLGDILSYFFNPQGGAYFPGWTINAILTGLIFGAFLYKNNTSLKNIVFAKIIILVFVEILLGSLWLNIQFGMPFFATLITRAVANTLAAPFEVAIIYFVGKALIKVPFIRDRELRRNS